MHPTRRCNLRCLHCYSASGPDVDETLSLDVLAAAVQDAAALGYDVLGVSGGEPLLYRPLLDLLRAARDAGMRTTVTTNGLLLTERRLGELAGLVDVLAVSLDGTPATHDLLRADPRAWDRMSSRLPAVRASGIPWGFITTLTLTNVHELEWVAAYAVEQGASLLQVHPLEPEGYAREALADVVPDVVELAVAVLETARLRSEGRLTVQLDVASAHDLVGAPERFLALDAPPPRPLGHWVTPLVVETDGAVVPLTWGMDRAYGLGSLDDASLAALAEAWDPAPFLALCRRVHATATAEDAPAFLSWYAAVVEAARAVPARP